MNWSAQMKLMHIIMVSFGHIHACKFTKYVEYSAVVHRFTIALTSYSFATPSNCVTLSEVTDLRNWSPRLHRRPKSTINKWRLHALLYLFYFSFQNEKPICMLTWTHWRVLYTFDGSIFKPGGMPRKGNSRWKKTYYFSICPRWIYIMNCNINDKFSIISVYCIQLLVSHFT